MQRNIFSIRKMVIPFFLVLIVIGSMIGKQYATQNVPAAIWGTPVRFEQDTAMPYSGIEQVVADSEYLYILYSSNLGVVQVYNLNGDYQYSWKLYKHMNGSFFMAVQNDVLYIRDYHADIYVFSHGEFVSFLHDEEANAVKNAIPFSQFEENTPGYYIRNGSVWHSNNGIRQCVIERPLISVLFQNNFYFVLVVIIISGIGFVRFLKSRRKNTGDCP